MSPNVFIFGITSLLADVAGEMIFPILPLFLGIELGMSTVLIGLIEGSGESISSLLKVFSGWASDRFRKRKSLIIAGYFIAALGKPLLAVAHSVPVAFCARFFDRAGKGIRTPPRDALLAESAHDGQRGGVFGFHRTMDTLGAIIGNSITFILLYYAFSYRAIFWWATIPALLATIVLLYVRETPTDFPVVLKKTPARKTHLFRDIHAHHKHFGSAFWIFLTIAVIFALGNTSYAFLLLRAQASGVTLALIPVLYFIFNIFQAVLAWPFGRASDKIGKAPFLLLGYVVFCVMSLGFVYFTSTWSIIALFVLYGVFFAANEGTARAFIVDLVPGEYKATALGVYFMAIGVMALPAGLLSGYLWKYGDGIGTFWYSGALSATVAFLFWIFFIAFPYGKKNRQEKSSIIR